MEEDGLYQIALKQKAGPAPGRVCHTKPYDRREFPFEEMKRIRFHYDRDWQMNVLGGEEPYLFHFTKGTHRSE